MRVGVGTDVTLGVAFGGGVNHRWPAGAGHAEVGPVLFYSHSEETTEEFHTYEETTDLVAVGVMANYLVGYTPGASAPFLVAGLGLAGMNVAWEERSATDVSLGTPLAGGGSMQSEEGAAGGSVVNVGVGYAFERSDVRVEMPVFIIAGAPGGAATVAPTLTVTYGFRF